MSRSIRGPGGGLGGLFRREDFLRNPLKALWRRFVWRLRWRICREPWVLRFKEDLRIAVARDGLGSMLYYQGFSEPETEAFFRRFLRPGMVFLDVGAHVGKYTLLAARAVGDQGGVHAFEPNPEVFGLLEWNLRLNSLRNVRAHRAAVLDVEEERVFEVCRELTVSALSRNAASASDRTGMRGITKLVSVRCLCLDRYCTALPAKVDLVKVDVEGSELFVFRGAGKLLELPAETAPVWVFEYAPTNYAHFGYGPEELAGLLRRNGYQLWRLCVDGDIQPFRPSPQDKPSLNLLASKDSRRLRLQP